MTPAAPDPDPDLRLLGYADHLSVRPGEEIRFMVSAPARAFHAELVRLRGVDTRPGASGRVREEVIPAPFTGKHTGKAQPLVTGSYARVDMPAAESLSSFGLHGWVQPTAVARGPQTIAHVVAPDGGAGVELAIDADRRLSLELTSNDGSRSQVVSPVQIVDKRWMSVHAGYDAETRRAHLTCERLGRWPGERESARVEAQLDSPWEAAAARVLLAARAHGDAGQPTRRFNGRIEAPRLFTRPLSAREQVALDAGTRPAEVAGDAILAAWDFSLDIGTQTITDTSSRALHGRLIQRPTRAVVGHAWSGKHLRFAENPSEWGAIHFHDDDLDDAEWEPAFAYTVPPGLPSGIYAARLSHDGVYEHVPFYVRGAVADADVLFIAPTNTYLAYGNEHLAAGDRGEALGRMMHEPIRLNDADRYLMEHPELGRALYDTHADGSGVAYSSRLRPILNMRPDYETWLVAGRRHFAADFYITGWLEAMGVPFHVATDEDLDAEGLGLLARYRVVLTGSHPEYPTGREYDALEEYVAHGGRLMYLGGNGFYWVTSFDGQDRHVIESRRGFAGQRNWTSHPAEVDHSTTGEIGGMWMHRGRFAQRLVGVGMFAAGFGPASGYSRTSESYDDDVAWVFEGIAEEVIGDFGLVLGGAAGDELDNTDPELGTPRHARVLAFSQHNQYYLPTLETQIEIVPGLDGSRNPSVRSEVVLFETDMGGMVFSAGSICWAASMAFDGYDNNVSRLTRNVLAAFLDEPRHRLSLSVPEGAVPSDDGRKHR
jgi:N,N-dimethylformamidase